MSRRARTIPRPRRGAIHPTPPAVLAAVLAVVLAGAPALAARKAGDGAVAGTITSIDGEPLQGVEITLEAADGTRSTATTDKRGKFSMTVPAGEYVVALDRDGYAPFSSPLSVTAGGRQVISAQLLDAAAGRRSEAAQQYNAAVAALEAGDRAAARAGLLAALEADPALLEPRQVLADMYLDEGSWAEAAEAASMVLAARPEDRQMLLIAYEAYRELEDTDRVVATRRSLASDPGMAARLAVHAFNEGATADQDGDEVVAEARFREALELDDGLAAAHFALATLQYRAGRYEEASGALARGLAIEPASAQGRRLAFLVAEKRGDPAAAAVAFDAYAEVDTAGAVDILFQRAEVDFRNGDTEPARLELSRVVELQPDHAAAHHLLGLAWLTGDTAIAKTHLRRFLELAPGDPEAAAVREILATLE